MSTQHVLYLRDGVPWRVRLDAGVSLQLVAPPHADRRVPLARLSRVICGSVVQWDTTALLACARAGVPVTFEDGRGRAVAWCFGGTRRHCSLRRLLRIAMDCHCWPERYRAWLEDQHRHAMGNLCLRHGLVARRLQSAHVLGLINNYIHRRLGFRVGPWIDAGRSSISAWTARRLLDRLGDPKLLVHAHPGWQLLPDVAGLLEWTTLDVLACANPVELHQEGDPGRWFARRLETDEKPWRQAMDGALQVLEGVLARDYA